MRLFLWHRSYFFFFILTCFACRQNQKPDVSGIDVTIEIERFDQELSKLTLANIDTLNKKWQQAYPYFYRDFAMRLLSVGDPKDTLSVRQHYASLLQSTDFTQLKADIQKKYPSLEQQEKELSSAFRYLRHYFPQAEIPRIIAFFSGFSVQIPIGKDYIGIGLDMFLGEDSPYYQSLAAQIPHYISRRFTPTYIVPRVLETYVRESLYPHTDDFDLFLDQMIYYGKIIYILDLVLPDIPAEIKLGYTAEQLSWARQYEADIWTYFIAQNLLFSSDLQKTQKYIGEAPFTSGLGQGRESAPKLGVFIGWQIVKQYMKEHPATSLADLLKAKDGQMLLKKAGYRGNRWHKLKRSDHFNCTFSVNTGGA